jgi:hypothetical protein
MKIAILGLIAALGLSACEGHGTVAETDGDYRGGLVIRQGRSLDVPPATVHRDASPPQAIHVDLPYVLNLESAVAGLRLEEVPALPGFDQQLVYTTERSIRGRTWRRLRLGFFANRAEAEAARGQLRNRYPRAWISKSDAAERRLAHRQGRVAGAQSRSLSQPGSDPVPGVSPAAAAAAPTEGAARPVQPAATASTEPAAGASAAALPQPGSQAHSDAGGQAGFYDAGTPIIRAAANRHGTLRNAAPTGLSYGRDANESLFVRSTHKAGDLFTMGTAFRQSTQKTSDLTARANQDRAYWNMNIRSAEGGPRPALEAEFAQSAFDPETSEGFGSSRNRMLKLAAHDDWRDYRLGLSYQSVGTRFDEAGVIPEWRDKAAGDPRSQRQKGRQSTEAWVSRQFGDLGVKTVAALYQDEVDDQGGASQFTTQQLGASLNYTILSWPQLGVTLDYASGARSSAGGQAGASSSEVGVANIAGSLYYSDSSVSGTLYVENATGAGTTVAMDMSSYYLGGSYFPVSTFSLSPSLNYVQENYTELGATTDNYTASMTASYKPSPRSRFSFDGYSEYSTQKNADWALDTQYFYHSLGVNWVSDKPKPLIKQWSFEVFHDQYTDNVYSGNNTGGFGFWLTLKSAPTPIKRLVDDMR